LLSADPVTTTRLIGIAELLLVRKRRRWLVAMLWKSVWQLQLVAVDEKVEVLQMSLTVLTLEEVVEEMIREQAG
jgi:hypothetical protein